MCSLFGGVKMETDSSDVVRCSCIAEYIVLSQNSVFFLFTYVFRGQRHLKAHVVVRGATASAAVEVG